MDVKLGTSLLFTVTYCSRIHEYNSSDSSDSVSYSSRLASYWAASLEFEQLLCNCFIKLIDSEHDRGICKIFWRVRLQMDRQCKHIRCANFISLLIFRFAWKGHSMKFDASKERISIMQKFKAGKSRLGTRQTSDTDGEPFQDCPASQVSSTAFSPPFKTFCWIQGPKSELKIA